MKTRTIFNSFKNHVPLRRISDTRNGNRPVTVISSLDLSQLCSRTLSDELQVPMRIENWPVDNCIFGQNLSFTFVVDKILGNIFVVPI